MQTENHYTETDLGNVSPNPKGNYDNAAKYEFLDLVTMQGGSYLCLAELGQTITGTAPEPGATTEYWQCLAMPGDRTPEYTEAHDKVVCLAKEVAQNTTKVAEDKQSVAQMETDVRQLKEQTAESARQAESSKDSAAGSARVAKTAEDNIRQVANNVNTLVSGFDTHVEEKTTEATQAVETAKDNAVQAVGRQETASVQAVKDQTTTYITEQKNLAKQELDKKVEQFGIDVNAIKAEVSKEGQKQITNVQEATTAELAKITEKGTEQTEAVAKEGTKQVQAVQTAAQEIIADREQINTNKEGVAKLKEDIANIYGWKEITPIEVVKGKLIQLETKDEYEASNSCYAKTEISDGVKKIKVSGRSASAQYGYGLAAFYDSNLRYISSIASEDSTEYVDKEVTVPNSAKYIIVNFNGMKGKVKNVSAFTAMPVTDEIKKIDNSCNTNTIQIQKIDSNILKIQNKFEFDIKMNIAGILGADPTQPNKIVYSDDENARCSDYIDCQNFKYISAKCNGSEWSWVIAFFTADKLFLPDISIVGVAGKLTYEAEIPESAKYVRVSTYNIDISYFAKIMFSKNNVDADISDLQARVNALESPDDIYNGSEFALFKKWGLIGDSLSVGHTVSKDGKTVSGRNIYYSWGQYLARRIGNTCLNFGRSGVTSKLWMDTSETYCYPRLINPGNLCQAYIIALGANDSEMTLGSIADVNFTDMSQNADTEYGCYAKVINAVRNVSANVPIFLFTLPYPRNSDVKIKAINEMIRTFASDKEHFGKIFLVDLDADYNKYFETGKLEAQIGNTGWHLTSLGYLYASKVNEIALSKVISDNYGDFQDVFLLPCGNNDVLD